SLLGTAAAVMLLVVWPDVLGADLLPYRDVAIVGLLAIPATNLSALITNAMAAARRVRASAIYGLLNAAAAALACTGGILLAGLRGYYWGSVLAAAALTGGGVWYLGRREGRSPGTGRIDLVAELRRYPNTVGFAASLYVLSFALPAAF